MGQQPQQSRMVTGFSSSSQQPAAKQSEQLQSQRGGQEENSSSWLAELLLGDALPRAALQGQSEENTTTTVEQQLQPKGMILVKQHHDAEQKQQQKPEEGESNNTNNKGAAGVKRSSNNGGDDNALPSPGGGKRRRQHIFMESWDEGDHFCLLAKEEADAVCRSFCVIMEEGSKPEDWCRTQVLRFNAESKQHCIQQSLYSPAQEEGEVSCAAEKWVDLDSVPVFVCDRIKWAKLPLFGVAEWPVQVIRPNRLAWQRILAAGLAKEYNASSSVLVYTFGRTPDTIHSVPEYQTRPFKVSDSPDQSKNSQLQKAHVLAIKAAKESRTLKKRISSPREKSQISTTAREKRMGKEDTSSPAPYAYAAALPSQGGKTSTRTPEDARGAGAPAARPPPGAPPGSRDPDRAAAAAAAAAVAEEAGAAGAPPGGRGGRSTGGLPDCRRCARAGAACSRERPSCARCLAQWNACSYPAAAAATAPLGGGGGRGGGKEWGEAAEPVGPGERRLPGRACRAAATIAAATTMETGAQPPAGGGNTNERAMGPEVPVDNDNNSGYWVNDCCKCENEEEGGEVLECGNNNTGCPRVFHPGCVGLQGIPEGDWWCPDCAKEKTPGFFGSRSRAFPEPPTLSSLFSNDIFPFSGDDHDGSMTLIRWKEVVTRTLNCTVVKNALSYQEGASLFLLWHILEYLYRHWCAEPFLEPVKADEVPDYHERIKKPMDLGTVRNNLREGKYDSASLVCKHIRQIWANAMVYNAHEAVPVTRSAQCLSILFERFLEERVIPFWKSSDPHLDSDSPTIMEVERALQRQKQKLDNWVADQKELVRKQAKSKVTTAPFLLNYEDQKERKKLVLHCFDKMWKTKIPGWKAEKMSPFSWDITPENCEKEGLPDYFSYVKKPMNLTKIKKRIHQKGRHQYTIANFIEDVKLMIKNCHLFNHNAADPGQAIVRAAADGFGRDLAAWAQRPDVLRLKALEEGRGGEAGAGGGGGDGGEGPPGEDGGGGGGEEAREGRAGAGDGGEHSRVGGGGAARR